jgi:CheY-like chemotaxis protein
VVDDDSDMRLYLRACLAALGSRVDRVMEAADGAEALRILRTESVQMVISDLLLPSLDGAGLHQAIRADPVHARLPVLLISGRGASGTAEGPCDEFLAKPFNARQLLIAVEKLLAVDSARESTDGAVHPSP